MEEKFKGRSAASISANEAQQWITSLVTPERSAHTVDNTWIGASRTVFGWAKEHNYIPRNPFENVKVTIPKRTKLRETQAFFPHEYRLILNASLEITDTSEPFEAAKRWVPWLLAYTGARPSEITQLRKHDVIERDGIPALHFTPAGSRKNRSAQAVPLHEHLIAQGFLTFVHDHSDGPLFYKPDQKATNDSPTKIKKPRSAQVRQRWFRVLIHFSTRDAIRLFALAAVPTIYAQRAYAVAGASSATRQVLVIRTERRENPQISRFCRRPSTNS